MNTSTKLPYQKDAEVFLETGEDKFQCMQAAITNSHLIELLNNQQSKSGKEKKDYLIAVKPDLMSASVKGNPSPVYTDPELVEYLIDKMYNNGFRNIAVVESENEFNYMYTGRSVEAVAELIGYQRKNYRIENLSNQKIPFDYGSVLKKNFVGKTWYDADFRISFAKNKTNWQCFFAGCLLNIYGCLPEWDKVKYYQGKAIEFYEACILIADRFPVHFGFLDAWVSADGFSRISGNTKLNMTKTIFASSNILALDWVIGEKMNMNPAYNYVIQEAMHRWGIVNIKRTGNMTPWYPWKNVRHFVIAIFDIIEEHYGLNRFLYRVFAGKMDPKFKAVSKRT